MIGARTMPKSPRPIAPIASDLRAHFARLVLSRAIEFVVRSDGSEGNSTLYEIIEADCLDALHHALEEFHGRVQSTRSGE